MYKIIIHAYDLKIEFNFPEGTLEDELIQLCEYLFLAHEVSKVEIWQYGKLLHEEIEA
jgi:hypothetical protein